MRRVGVAAIPNRCGACGRFKPWEELTLHFVPDSEFSSEDESWRECDDCYSERIEREESAEPASVDRGK